VTKARTRVDDKTRDADERSASASAGPDRGPSADEEADADETAEDLARVGTLERVGEHHREMTERGARQEGEGRIA
jgi:hypothetical protein